MLLEKYDKCAVTVRDDLLSKYHHMDETKDYISLESVERICRVLSCDIDDILKFVPEDNGGKENG